MANLVSRLGWRFPLKSILWVAAGTITGLPRESLGLKQSRRESAVRGKLIKFQSESITADLCLGVAIAGINTLIGADYRVRVSGPPQLATDQPQPGEAHSKNAWGRR